MFSDRHVLLSYISGMQTFRISRRKYILNGDLPFKFYLFSLSLLNPHHTNRWNISCSLFLAEKLGLGSSKIIPVIWYNCQILHLNSLSLESPLVFLKYYSFYSVAILFLCQ